MQIDSIKSSIHIVWHVDESGDKTSLPVTDEPQIVVNSRVVLLEIPDEFRGVTLKRADGTLMSEISMRDVNTPITDDSYKVHYGLGIIFVSENLEGEKLTASYNSRGAIYYPASRIFTGVDDLGNVIETFQDIVDNAGEAVNAVGTIDDKITTAQTLADLLDGKSVTASTSGNELQAVIDDAIIKKTQLTDEIGVADDRITTLSAYEASLTFDWSHIANIPTEFTPEAHTHETSEVTGLDTTIQSIRDTLSGKSDEHTHPYLPLTGGTMTGDIVMGDHVHVNTRFEMDAVDNSGVAYILLCENAVNNDVNGRLTMDRTSGLRHACQLDIIVSSGTNTGILPMGMLRSSGVTGSSVPTYKLVTCTYNEVSYVAVEITNPDRYYESSGGYFNGRIVSTGLMLNPVVSTDVTDVVEMADGKSNYGSDLYVKNNLVHHAGNFDPTSKADASHGHSIADVTNLQTELDGKAPTHDHPYLGATAQAVSSADSDKLQGLSADKFMRGRMKNYTSVDEDTGEDAWYTLFTVTDSSRAPIQCNIKAYAHTSASFVVSKGYSTTAHTLTVLNASTSSGNASYKYLKGLRLLTDGKVQIKLNSGASVAISAQIFGSDDYPYLENTLVRWTGDDSTVAISIDPLVHGSVTTDGDFYAGGNKVWHEGTFNPSSKSNVGHTHSIAEVTDMTLDWASITDKPSVFTPDAHTHVIADTSGLQSALDAKLSSLLKGVANGLAELDANGVVPASQLPSFVDDVVEYDTKDLFPATGESGKVYVDKDSNITYRWSGSTYTPIGSDLALGETSSTAYRGDRGKIAYDHSQTSHDYASSSHAHAIADVTNLQATLDGKIPMSGGYINGEITTPHRKRFAVDLSNAEDRWYKIANVNHGNSGLTLRGTLNNHVENFGTQKFDISIFGREANAVANVDIVGEFSVGYDGVGVLVVQGELYNGVYTTYDVYIKTTQYTQCEIEGIVEGNTGMVDWFTDGNYVTEEPTAVKELDTTTATEGRYTIVASQIYEVIHEGNFSDMYSVVANALPVSGGTMSGKLSMGGNDIDMQGGVLILGDTGGNTNVDHIWHDDATNTYHMVSDSARGSAGNSNLQVGVINAISDVRINGNSVALANHTTKPEDIQDGRTTKRFYLSTHPENQGVILPFVTNDLAHLTKRGGTMTTYVTDDTDFTAPTLNEVSAVSINTVNPFDGTPSYSNFTVSATTDVVVIDIVPHRTFSWGNNFYIDFGSTSWRAKDVKIYAMHTDPTNAEPVYKLMGSVTGSGYGSFHCANSHVWTDTDGTKHYNFDRLRFVLTNFNGTNPRIAGIGVITYNSSGLTETLLSRAGGTMLGSLIPQNTDTYALGDSSHRWVSLYAKGVTAETVTTTNATATTITSSTYSGRVLKSLGTELGIGAGEMGDQLSANMSGEILWLGGESGVKVVSSPDNLATGWDGRHEITLIDINGETTINELLRTDGATYWHSNNFDPASKADVDHTHEGTLTEVAIADVTGLQSALDGKSATGHGHAIVDVTGLLDELNSRAMASHTHTIAITDVISLETTLAGKASTSHSHTIANVTGLQTALNGKSATGHGHAIADVSGLQTALDGKSAVHSHPYLGSSAQAVDSAKLGGVSAGDYARLDRANMFASSILVSSGYYDHNSTDSYDKVRVWSSGSYSIGMKSAQTFGYLSDYAMTFTMSNTPNRGFLWRDSSDAVSDGAMSLTTDGRLYVKNIADVGALNVRNAGNAKVGGYDIWHKGNLKSPIYVDYKDVEETGECTVATICGVDESLSFRFTYDYSYDDTIWLSGFIDVVCNCQGPKIIDSRQVSDGNSQAEVYVYGDGGGNVNIMFNPSNALEATCTYKFSVIPYSDTSSISFHGQSDAVPITYSTYFDYSTAYSSTLRTTEKSDITQALNELFTSASSGKTAIANAITGSGGTANSGMTFAQLATAIGGLGGAKFATGTSTATTIAVELGWQANYVIFRGSAGGFAVFMRTAGTQTSDGYYGTTTATFNCIYADNLTYTGDALALSYTQGVTTLGSFTATGFSLPVPVNSHYPTYHDTWGTITWTAYE